MAVVFQQSSNTPTFEGPLSGSCPAALHVTPRVRSGPVRTAIHICFYSSGVRIINRSRMPRCLRGQNKRRFFFLRDISCLACPCSGQTRKSRWCIQANPRTTQYPYALAVSPACLGAHHPIAICVTNHDVPCHRVCARRQRKLFVGKPRQERYLLGCGYLKRIVQPVRCELVYRTDVNVPIAKVGQRTGHHVLTSSPGNFLINPHY